MKERSTRLLAAIVIGAFLVTGMGVGVAEGQRAQLPVQVGANSLAVAPIPGYSHGVLTIRLRGAGVVLEQDFDPQFGITQSLMTSAGLPFVDGRYVFEVWVAGSATGTQKLSGSFEIIGGSVSTETIEVDIKQDIVDITVLGDGIVEGALCASDSTECIFDLILFEDESFDTPGFGAADIKVKDNVPEIWFADTTAEDNDFALTVEDGFFFIRDPDADTLPFTIESGAPSDSFYVSQAGGVGVGTAIPEADIHVTNLDGSIDTVLKLHHPGSGSWNIGMRGENGVFTFNKVGTPQEFSVREVNHPIATLDVAGHVRGTSFKSTSSRGLKTGFATLDPGEVLAKVVEMPVTSWRYKSEGKGTKHFGPVAEDFQRLFGLGDGMTISSVDADGVALAAIQGLNTRLQAELAAQDKEIEALARSNAALASRLEAIEKEVAVLSH